MSLVRVPVDPEDPCHHRDGRSDDERVDQARPVAAWDPASHESHQPGTEERIPHQIDGVGNGWERLFVEHVGQHIPHDVAGHEHQLPDDQQVPRVPGPGPMSPHPHREGQGRRDPDHRVEDVLHGNRWDREIGRDPKDAQHEVDAPGSRAHSEGIVDRVPFVERPFMLWP